MVWLAKVCKLSTELSLSVNCFCDQSTKQHIEHALKSIKSNVIFKFDATEIWKDWRILKQKMMPDDFMIVVLDRKLETTYLLSLTYTQRKLEHLFESQTKLLIYPQI